MGGVVQLTLFSAESDDDGREASGEDSDDDDGREASGDDSDDSDASDTGGEESEVDA